MKFGGGTADARIDLAKNAKAVLTLLLAGAPAFTSAAPRPEEGRNLRIFLNERVAGPRGQRDGVGPDNKNARARRRARRTCGPRRKNRDASRSRTPRTTSIIMTTTFGTKIRSRTRARRLFSSSSWPASYAAAAGAAPRGG